MGSCTASVVDPLTGAFGEPKAYREGAATSALHAKTSASGLSAHPGGFLELWGAMVTRLFGTQRLPDTHRLLERPTGRASVDFHPGLSLKSMQAPAFLVIFDLAVSSPSPVM